MNVQKMKCRKLIIFAVLAAVVIAACAVVFASCSKVENRPSGQTEDPVQITAQQTETPENTPKPDPTPTPEPTLSPEELKYMPVSGKDASEKFQAYYAYGHAQRNDMVADEIEQVKAEVEQLYNDFIVRLEQYYYEDEWHREGRSYESYRELYIEPVKRYYEESLAYYGSDAFLDVHTALYCINSYGGNWQGDAALTDEYCRWTEFRYEMYKLTKMF